jgi:translation elongation factor EF-1beta
MLLMGKAMIIFKIKVKEPEEIDKAVAAIKGIKSGQVKDVKKFPIGFGIELIKAGILIDDKKEGSLEALTAEISSLPEVEEAEVEGMTLI